MQRKEEKKTTERKKENKCTFIFVQIPSSKNRFYSVQFKELNNNNKHK